MEAGWAYTLTLTLGSPLFPSVCFLQWPGYPLSIISWLRVSCPWPGREDVTPTLGCPIKTNQVNYHWMGAHTVTRVNIIHQCLLSELREGLFISVVHFQHRTLLQIMIQNNVSCRYPVWIMVCWELSVTVSSVCWSFVDGCVQCPGSVLAALIIMTLIMYNGHYNHYHRRDVIIITAINYLLMLTKTVAHKW